MNKEAFFCWAMQYALHTEVIEPVEMRERIQDAVRHLNEKYNGNVYLPQKGGTDGLTQIKENGETTPNFV